MKPSEELLLFLELNNYKIEKFILKTKSEYEKTGNLELHKCSKYTDLVVCHYSYLGDNSYINRNPFSYKYDWDDEVESIDQFIINHPDLQGRLTLKEFLQSEKHDKNNKKRILNSILDQWLKEYHEAKVASVENLKVINSINDTDIDIYNKPSEFSFFLVIVFALINLVLFSSGFITNPDELLYSTPWYGLLGTISTLLFVLYAIRSNSLSRQLIALKNEKKVKSIKVFDKFDKDMEKARLTQSKVINSYVDLVIKNPDNSEFELMPLIGPEILIDRLRVYVKIVEKKQNWMTHNYPKKMHNLKVLFTITVILFILFIGLGILTTRGFINV